MKKLIMAAATAMLTMGAMAQQGPVRPGDGHSYTYENYIQVTGKAEREIAPDEIYVRIVINEKELKLKKTVEQMEKDMLSKLRSLNIDTDKNLKIDNMSSGYKDYFLKGGQARTTASYQLKVSSAAELGLAYQALESVGISNMTVVKQSHSRIREIQKEMRIEAIKNAQEIAKEMTDAIGQKIGKAVHIVDYNNDFYTPVARNEFSLSAKSAGVADSYYETPLEFNDMKLNYSVTVKFSLDN